MLSLPALHSPGVELRLCFVQVYDIAFSRAGGGRDMFASVGADGSVRMFDLRHLEHSTIIYEDPQHHPLLRLCWNKQDPNYLATMAMDGMEVRQQLISPRCSWWFSGGDGLIVIYSQVFKVSGQCQYLRYD